MFYSVLIPLLLTSTLLIKSTQAQADGGACCVGYDDGSSACYQFPNDSDQGLCEIVLGGTWMGIGTLCSEVTCNIGACCVNDFEYQCWENVTDIECNNLSGDYLGMNSTCAVEGSFCNAVYGACCIPSQEECIDHVTEEECNWWEKSDFLGEGSTCVNDSWCTNYGSCCYGTWCDDFVQENDCEDFGGIFWSDSCDQLGDVPWCVDCASDLDQDGETNVSDLLTIIAAWGVDCNGCSEDLNNDANVNVADLLILIGSWGPCE